MLTIHTSATREVLMAYSKIIKVLNIWKFLECFRVQREANVDATVNGVEIPQGMTVNTHIYAVHHDEDYWENPEIYNPERYSMYLYKQQLCSSTWKVMKSI